MTWFEALLLGLVQGLTEFLPVSSSGHLEIGNALLGVSGDDNLLFAVVVHAATALSTVVVFRRDIAVLIVDLLRFEWNESTTFSMKIIVSMIPVGIVGVFFADQIESFFSGNMLLVGGMLIVTATLLLFSHIKRSGTKDVTFLAAIIIGIAQAFAVLPGISRSGATIATALLLGTERSRAARFSFLMVLIPILGASMLKLKDYMEMGGSQNLSAMVLFTGFLAAFVSGYLACSWMIKIVKRGKLSYFAIYCIIVGLTAIISSYWL